jgi:hypothetical protein
MAEKEAPKGLPIIPLNGPTLAAHVALAAFHPGNNGITLAIAEERDAVAQLGAPLVRALFELGRFSLTPRALRELSDSVQAAIKAYEDSIGTLPTKTDFMARFAMKGLLTPPSVSGGPESPKPEP